MTAPRAVAAALLLALPLAGQGPARILWVSRPEARSPEFWEAARKLGFTAVNVSSGADPELPGRFGLGFYLDQPGGKGVLELRDAQWEPLREAYERTRRASTLVRPSCLSDPEVLAAAAKLVRERVGDAAGAGPLGIALGDEVSLTRHANPLDLCFSPHCLARFRSWLQERHGDLASLNRAWHTEFSTWDQVLPLTTDQMRRRALLGAGLPADLRPWAEHREFMDEVLAAAVTRLQQVAAESAPAVPCGLTGLQPPSAFGGHDYRRLLPELAFYEAYDIGGARELAMSLAPAGARQLVTLFPPAEGEVPELVTARYAEALAHGASAVVAWSGDTVLDERARPTSFGRALTRAFSDLRGAEVLAGARLQYSKLFVVESQAAVRAWWMLDSAGDGLTWIRRRSSYEAAHSTSLAARHSWVRLLEDLGLQPELVPEQDLADRLPRDRPLAVVLPASIALSDAAVFALRVYTTAGGTLLADHSPALYDEYLRRRRQAGLDELFGLQRSERDYELLVRQGRAAASGQLRTGAAAAEAGLRGKLAEESGAFSVFVESRPGRGHAVYLNLAVCEYGRARLDPGRVDLALDLRRRVRHVLHGAGLRPPVDVRGPGLPTCLERMVLRGAGGRRFLAVRCNALESPAILAELARRENPEIELRFPGPVRLQDLLTGRELEPAASVTRRFDPYRGLFFEILTGR